ncbi:MAG TPA: chemotaxis protein CheA [Chloroflexota bacterium]|jgi:two-component system chemotaxis sensor kinase CheA|nr:chemotaxis protein CheA [Chloroflexota bacterium]
MIDSPKMPTGELQFDLSPDDQALFLAEVDELIQRVEESLVDLERAPDDKALLNEIFRAAHTIKGSSATIGHTRMAALTHAMETRLDDLRKGTASVTPQLIEALLKALDVLKLLRDEVETRVPASVDVDAAAAAVERRSTKRADAAARARSSKRSVKVAKPSNPDATHRFTIGLEDGPWVAVRALQALLALGDHGTVLFSEPSQAEIEREDAQLGKSLLVLVKSDASEQTLRDALKAVPELGAIVGETLGDADSAASDEAIPTEAALPEPVLHDAVNTPTAAGAATQRPNAAAKTIRIDVARLDALLNLVGELVIDRTRLVQLGSALADQYGDDRTLSDLQQTSLHIGRITDELQEQVMKSRMLPVESVFNRLPRVVRDVAAKQGKQIDFIMEGKDTELDRSVIEEIGDPLLHLIRNGVDHGIETPDKRLAAGKPASGTLRLTARHADSFILISLEDDGDGVNIEAVKRKAVEKGVITQEQADRMSDDEAVQLIFAPGLSTAQALSDVSGRGVGMDVVRANVEKINGSVDVQTRRGQGTTFTIRLPLTLAIVQALLVRVAGGTYALPIHAVTETLRVEPHQIHRVNHREAIQLRETVLPLVSVRHIFGVGPDEAAAETGDGSRLVVAVHTTNSRQVGLIVDGLVGEQEIVIKPLGALVGDVAGVSGAAILGDGSVALIVDVAALIGQAIRDNTTVAPLLVDLQERHAA